MFDRPSAPPPASFPATTATVEQLTRSSIISNKPDHRKVRRCSGARSSSSMSQRLAAVVSGHAQHPSPEGISSPRHWPHAWVVINICRSPDAPRRLFLPRGSGLRRRTFDRAFYRAPAFPGRGATISWFVCPSSFISNRRDGRWCSEGPAARASSPMVKIGGPACFLVGVGSDFCQINPPALVVGSLFSISGQGFDGRTRNRPDPLPFSPPSSSLDRGQRRIHEP